MASNESPLRTTSMAASETAVGGLLGGSVSQARLIESFVEPLLALLTLFFTASAFDIAADGNHVILGLFTFALLFPGRLLLTGSVPTMIRRTLLEWMLVAAALVGLGHVTGYLDEFAPHLLLAWLVATPFALVAGHLGARLLLPRLMSREGVQRRTVIVGCNDTAMHLARTIEENPVLGVRLLGFFDDRAEHRLPPERRRDRLGDLDALADYVGRHGVAQVYIALPMVSQPRILALLDALKDTTASIYFVPDLFVTDLVQGRVDDVAGTPVVAVCETPFTGMNGLVKRLSDIVLATLILVLIAPLLAAIAIGVKLSGPGPVLFRQQRHGIDGRRIVVYKFRSMTVCEDGERIAQATRNDRRVTRFGAFLRRTSLDELPQFINVIQGRMSVVGPRPHAVAHNEAYRRLIKGYMIRHKVRPGITGWAQVNGCRGETDTVDKMARRIEYDLDYLRHWSLALDLRIIARTARLVLKDAQAY